MPLPVTNRRRSSDVMYSEKSKSLIRHDETKNEAHDASGSAKKSELSVSTSVHRKSDADKSLHHDTMEKIAHKGSHSFISSLEIFDRITIVWTVLFFFRLAPNDSYLYESTEFAGVTVTVRTANATKGCGNTDFNGKAGARRKSEFHQPPAGLQQKFEPGDRSDQPGTWFSFARPLSHQSLVTVVLCCVHCHWFQIDSLSVTSHLPQLKCGVHTSCTFSSLVHCLVYNEETALPIVNLLNYWSIF